MANVAGFSVRKAAHGPQIQMMSEWATPPSALGRHVRCNGPPQAAPDKPSKDSLETAPLRKGSALARKPIPLQGRSKRSRIAVGPEWGPPEHLAATYAEAQTPPEQPDTEKPRQCNFLESKARCRPTLLLRPKCCAHPQAQPPQKLVHGVRLRRPAEGS